VPFNGCSNVRQRVRRPLAGNRPRFAFLLTPSPRAPAAAADLLFVYCRLMTATPFLLLLVRWMPNAPRALCAHSMLLSFAVRTPLPILRPSSLGWTAQQYAQSAMPHAIFTRDKFRCHLQCILIKYIHILLVYKHIIYVYFFLIGL
jgi:hypothetical protein